MENQSEPQVEQAQQPAPAQPELTIVDLQNIKAIFDVAARRGTFAAGEMASIGTVYNKLSGFLDAVAPQAGNTEQDTPEA
jgi:hypothetical protein